ncbi:hypothetical protein [Allorhizobium borbori]|uniref:Uncharacterized protein n=1 Tax=Allorhizobium borbori TaxID=485907 RepID=A0A7W6P1A4_9HYPH|nr:hypothetical protein [Allorhizobium borbori]MBB4102666.1 hypothetical protein [Allorhizobium borbori]
MHKNSINVFIATPCYGGVVYKDYMQSVIATMHEAGKYGVQLTLALLGNDALITRSRNSLVSSFLNDTDATHLLFIDADISFEAEQIIRLLRADKDVVAGMYPIKDYDWDNAGHRLESGETFAQSGMHYVGTPMPGDKAEWDGEFVTAIYAGTGMLMIKRAALERMVNAYPDLRYSGVHAFPRPKKSPSTKYALFECMIEEDTGLYLSEDYAFCHRWRQLGGKVWLDTAGRLTHTGSHHFVGNPAVRHSVSMQA